jgi:hypothetical protein
MEMSTNHFFAQRERFLTASELCIIDFRKPILEEREMRLKLLVAAAAVVGAGIVATTNLATARNYVLNPADCVPPSNPPLRWYSSYYSNYFVPNWEPFFRRHVYVAGPILACAATSAATVAPVISSKY